MFRYAAIALALFMGGHLAAAEDVVPTSKQQLQLSFSPIVKLAAPAVVNVYTKRVVRQRENALYEDPFFRRFFGEDGDFGRPRERVASSLGSGVIVDGKGFIVTNNHVIDKADDIVVALSDRREFPAKLLLADEKTDLAVLKIDAGDEKLPTLKLSDSDDLEVGDLVLAIGNPFGVGQTVTSGIVSALARTRVGVTDYQFFIQTDAAINPGNSGGALVNMSGDLVGINTAIYSRSGGSIGIGFSIPSNMVRTVIASAEGGSKKIKRPWLGVDLQDVTAELAESLGLARPEGTLILNLHPQSPLLAAGLKRGDVVLSIDDKAVESSQEFGFRVGTAQIGDTRIIEYRRGEKTFETSMKLVAAPETTPRQETLIDTPSPFAGLVVANLSPAVAEEIDAGVDAVGVVALEVKADPAARIFQKGDLILGVNGKDVASVSDLMTLVAERQSRWVIAIQRGKRKLVLRLRG
jgi:Do/DeqQ family serine protease